MMPAPVRTFSAIGGSDDVYVGGQLYSTDYVRQAVEYHNNLVQAVNEAADWIEAHSFDTPVAEVRKEIELIVRLRVMSQNAQRS